MSFNPISPVNTGLPVSQNENQPPKHARINALLQEATRGIAGLFLTKTAPLVSQAQAQQPQVVQPQVVQPQVVQPQVQQPQVVQSPQKRKPMSASADEVPKKSR